MGTHDPQSLRTEADILARQSRPQRNSTWVPKMRDWRYATGVIQHDDFEGAPKSRSVWDTLDYDYQAAADKRSPGESLAESQSSTSTSRSIEETPKDARTPTRATFEVPTESPKMAEESTGPYRPMESRKRVWRQVKKFTLRSDTTEEEGKEAFDVTGLVVRLRFTRKNKARLQDVLQRPVSPLSVAASIELATRSPSMNRVPSSTKSSTRTPEVVRAAESEIIQTPHVLNPVESTFPLFKRAWVDETYDFNTKIVRSNLRHKNVKVESLGDNYAWYNDAVPVDAILPPGLPISAKEIQAYYPHHVRWKGVMLRLTNNDYRGADILGMQVGLGHNRYTADEHD